MRSRVALAVLLLVGPLAGCVSGADLAEDVGRKPTCTSRPGTVQRGLLIMAQAVPSAQWLPCIRAIPLGWTFSEIRPRDGEVSMLFDSDRDGMHALTVLLRPSCDLTGATEVPAEQPEIRRFERVTRVSSGYGGERYHTFEGGCVTYRFDLRGADRAEPVAAISEGLAFLSRRDLDDRVREISDDRLRLDADGRTP